MNHKHMGCVFFFILYMPKDIGVSKSFFIFLLIWTHWVSISYILFLLKDFTRFSRWNNSKQGAAKSSSWMRGYTVQRRAVSSTQSSIQKLWPHIIAMLLTENIDVVGMSGFMTACHHHSIATQRASTARALSSSLFVISSFENHKKTETSRWWSIFFGGGEIGNTHTCSVNTPQRYLLCLWKTWLQILPSECKFTITWPKLCTTIPGFQK